MKLVEGPKLIPPTALLGWVPHLAQGGYGRGMESYDIQLGASRWPSKALRDVGRHPGQAASNAALLKPIIPVFASRTSLLPYKILPDMTASFSSLEYIAKTKSLTDLYHNSVMG